MYLSDQVEQAKVLYQIKFMAQKLGIVCLPSLDAILWQSQGGGGYQGEERGGAFTRGEMREKDEE